MRVLCKLRIISAQDHLPSGLPQLPLGRFCQKQLNAVFEQELGLRPTAPRLGPLEYQLKDTFPKENVITTICFICHFYFLLVKYVKS